MIFLFYFGPPPLLLVKCVRLSGHSSRFQNYFRISSISYQKNWIGVWILSISPPPLLFLFFLFDLLIKVQVQVACLSERTYRESQKLHVCICLHVSASLACALVRVEDCPAVISRCPGGHFIQPWMADCSRSLMGSRNQLKESQNQHFILALVCLALAAAHAKYAQVRARNLPPPVFFSSVSTLYCYFTNNQMQCHVKD